MILSLKRCLSNLLLLLFRHRLPIGSAEKGSEASDWECEAVVEVGHGRRRPITTELVGVVGVVRRGGNGSFERLSSRNSFKWSGS